MDTDPSHHIDRHILRVLTFNERARYRDLRPKNTDSNLFNYHRKVLLKQGYIKKNDDNSYSLAVKGFRLAEKATFDDLRVRDRPKLSVLFLLTNMAGELAVWRKQVQPFIGTINVPNGKMRLSDESGVAAAARIMAEIAPATQVQAVQRGVAEVFISQAGEVISHAVYVVAAATVEKTDVSHGAIFWVQPADMGQLDMTPGIKQICDDFLHTTTPHFKHYTFAL